MISKKTKCYILFDSSYMVRENLGFLRTNDEEIIKPMIIKMIMSNYGSSKKDANHYYKENISYTEVKSNFTDKEIEQRFAEGLNWMGNLREVSCNELRLGLKERKKIIKELKQKEIKVKSIKKLLGHSAKRGKQNGKKT